MGYLKLLEEAVKNKKVPPAFFEPLKLWHENYIKAAVQNGYNKETCDPILIQFLAYVIDNLQSPYSFEPFHQRIVSPDFYQFGIEFIRPLIIKKESTALNLDIASKIEHQLVKGENAILLANHQTELDPQAISYLLEDIYPDLAKEMIFVAGHRVTTDPMAIPFSKGRNLLCIYSKKYVEDDPETKEEKLLHNKRTMSRMAELLSEGGKCIYVAPSGGRDRPDHLGKPKVAPFDPQSIEMFWLMAQKAEKQTHFYPLALATYDLLPPPDKVISQLGEPRKTKATSIHLAFGPEIDMETFPGHDQEDKKERRKLRADFICSQVVELYSQLS